MDILTSLQNKILFLDGGLGTMLQQSGLASGELPESFCLTHPDVLLSIHRAYIKAGCNVISTNTFGATAPKLTGSGYTPSKIVTSAVALVKEAIRLENAEDRCVVGLDLGPTGKLLAPLGDLAFEDAVTYFKEVILAGVGAGADLVLIETMTDSYELKAAVLAAKECCNLPVFATVSIDKNGKLLTGGDLSSVVALLEGLRVDALGLNCGFGPAELLPRLLELLLVSSLPVILTPNAGIPREAAGKTVFDVDPESFARLMEMAAKQGARILGGCCGTTPAHMEAMIRLTKDLSPVPLTNKERTVISNYSHAVLFGEGTVPIGERINPTGKPKLKEALRNEQDDYVVRLAVEQQKNGAVVLDVNAGLPEIDETKTLERLVVRLQNTVNLPLEIDTANPAAMERAMRIYNGKPLVNSVSGKRESMDAVFPLIQKYGGVAVALLLDETGIPKTAKGRLAVAERILAEAKKYGLTKEDFLFDALTMAVSAGGENAAVTLETLRLLQSELGAKTTLGISNVSFGLPAREEINASMLSMAMNCGLSAVILNPNSESMMNAYYSANALLSGDRNFERFIARFSDQPKDNTPKPNAAPLSLKSAIESGLSDESSQLAKQLLLSRLPLEIIDGEIVPALESVGIGFEKGTLFLPQLMMSAEASKAAFSVINAALGTAKSESKGTIVVATVKGDIHDIGKNIAKALLENYQYRVIDLGRDVPPEAVLDAAKNNQVKLVGLSALMTTTVASMRETVALLKEHLPDCRIMVGGAVLSQTYADEMGADAYVKDAMASVRYANHIFLQ